MSMGSIQGLQDNFASEDAGHLKWHLHRRENNRYLSLLLVI
jgi:hypothetical protein